MNDKKARKPFLKDVNTMNVMALTADGEFYTAEKRIQIVEEDDKKFLMTFSEFVVFINTSDSMVDVKVFTWISEHLGYNEDKITLTRPNKEEIMKFTGFSYSAVEKSISSLTKKQILVKDNKYPRGGTYHINPSYVWYGDREVRKNKLKFVLELIQNNNLPDKEKERLEDMARYDKWYNEQNSVNRDDVNGNSKKTRGNKSTPQYETSVQENETEFQKEVEELYKEKDPEQL